MLWAFIFWQNRKKLIKKQKNNWFKHCVFVFDFMRLYMIDCIIFPLRYAKHQIIGTATWSIHLCWLSSQRTPLPCNRVPVSVSGDWKGWFGCKVGLDWQGVCLHRFAVEHGHWVKAVWLIGRKGGGGRHNTLVTKVLC